MMTVAGALVALTMAGGAAAQAPGAGYPQPGMRMQAPPPPPMSGPMRMPAPMPAAGAPRWGSKVGGRWWGGMNAPGGYGAYRTPARGYRLPGYWTAPRFHVGDWNRYGFATPPQGYRWTRYYDDAVLIDGRGQVFDSVGAVDWDNGGYARRDNERDIGLGGAAIGAVVGGVAGNVIGGRGNRLGGTLIGAGVGAAAGYAIDKNEDGRHGSTYREPPRMGGYAAAEDGYDRRGGRTVMVHRGSGRSNWTSNDGSVTVVTTDGGYQGGYAQDGYARAGSYAYNGGYGYGGGSVTTVTVENAPVVTTTTTQVIEDRVTYRPVHVRQTRRVWRQRGKDICNCAR